MTNSSSLKLITANIEGSHHLHRIIPWLKKEKPDVLCLQELFAADVPLFEEALSAVAHFTPLSNIDQKNQYNIPARGLWGIGIFTAMKIESVQSFFYKGDSSNVPDYSDPNSVNRALLQATVKKGRSTFNIANTHFTWSPAGEATDEQRRDLARLLELVDEFDVLVLCGDFNAPRGREIYSRLAQTLNDQLPDKITTTIDPELHYAGALELVVDSIFTKPGYKAKNVKVKSGVSDHMAIVAEISKA